MAPTSDERREVAREMREVTDGECDAIYIDGILCRILGDRYCRDDEFQISSKLILPRLADLIDPTCSVVRRQAYTGGPQMYKTLWCCSECGFPLAESKYKGHRPFVEERFCPNCGARVVSGDDN